MTTEERLDKLEKRCVSLENRLDNLSGEYCIVLTEYGSFPLLKKRRIERTIGDRQTRS